MMKSIVSMLFVLAAALLLSSPIQAGYTDGMNQYAAYHVMHGGVDPSGLEWEITRRNGDRATAKPTDIGNDTIDALAVKAGFNTSEVGSWITLPRGGVNLASGMGKEANQLNGLDAPCEQVEIPNTILALWMGSKKDAYASDYDQQVFVLGTKGFKVKSMASTAAWGGEAVYIPAKTRARLFSQNYIASGAVSITPRLFI